MVKYFRIRKIIAVILVAAAVMTGFQGCKKESGSTESGSDQNNAPKIEIREIDIEGPEYASRKIDFTRPADGVTINGVDASDYVIVVKNKANDSFGSAAMALQHYLEKYCGVSIGIADDKTERAPHEICIGISERNPVKYDNFTSEIYCKDGSIYLCGGNKSDCEQVVNAFICKYLDGTGHITANLPEDGSPCYKSSGEPDWQTLPSHYTIQDKIVATCKKVQHIYEYDSSKGKYYTYQGNGYKNTLEDARRSDVLVTNCVIVTNWVLKDIGLWEKGIVNIKYDGTCGYTFSSDSCRQVFHDDFDVLKIPENMTLKSMYADGNLYPGDIIFFSNHMQVVIDGTRAFDGGRPNTFEVRTGSEFMHFLGQNTCLNYNPGYIIRAKDAERW